MTLYEIEYQHDGKNYSVTCQCEPEQGEQVASMLESYRHGVVVSQREFTRKELE